MIDSHAHLYFDRFDEDRQEVLQRAREAGVSHFVCVGIDLESSQQALALATSESDFSATAGIHPCDCGGIEESTWQGIEALLQEEKVRAVGETGLDYYWDKVPREEQIQSLLRHAELAAKYDLPLVVHCRDAWDDLLDTLEQKAPKIRGIMHCYSGGLKEAERTLNLGFDFSFAGPLTYPRNKELREVCKEAPADRIHIETDCPFLPPQGFRGKRNEPAYMTKIIEQIAELKDWTLEVTQAHTDANTKRLFGIT